LKRVTLLTLLIVLVGLLYGGEVVELGSFPIDLRGVTKEVVEEELAWYFSPSDYLLVEIRAITIDQESFETDDAYFISLALKWDGGEVEQTIAFLVSSEKGWLEPYISHLKRYLRLSFGRHLAPKETPFITEIIEGGLWAKGPLTGRRVVVKDLDSKAIAILEVASRDADVSELVPVWSKRNLSVGMPLERLKGDYPLEVIPRFSGEHYGVALGVAYPLWVGPFRLTQRLSIDLPYSGSTPIIEIFLGLEKKISLGAFQKGSAPLGKWWNNLQLGVSLHVGGGVALKEGGVTYSYGTTIEAQILHQSSAHLYWGLSGGYKYRVVDGVGGGDFLLSPVIGWLW
jgi:hypothetical protein